MRSPEFALKYVVNERRDTFRVAAVVSRKVSKSAVVRNRIRRRVYEAVRSYEARINAPFDIVITVFSEQVAEMPHTQLTRQIGNLLRKAGIASGNSAKKQHDMIEEKER